jgi:hypothetical protein
VLPFDQKLTLGLLATITFKAVTFCAYAPFLPPSPQLCQMAASQFYLQSGKQRLVGLVGVDSHVVFRKKKIPGEKGSM